jgi:orotidine-5'-phosphate decarboxylase
LLTAVTILTSLEHEDLQEVGVDIEPMVQVQRLARLTQDCGLDGVVCSAREAKALRGALGDDFLLVTPGIRLADSAADDQKRIVTPAQAMENGSSYLVVGRPITRADDPCAALDGILATL